MSPLVIKTVIGATALGVTGIGTWKIYDQFSTRTIEKQLQQEKLKILNTEYGQKNEEWQTKADANKSNLKAKAFINRQKEESSAHEEVLDANVLREACSKVMSKPNIDPDLEDARAFCTDENNT